MHLVGPDRVVIIEAIDYALHNFIAGEVFDLAPHREGPAHSGFVAVYRLGAVVDDHLRAGPVAIAHQGKPGVEHRRVQLAGYGCIADVGPQMQHTAIFLYRDLRGRYIRLAVNILEMHRIAGILCNILHVGRHQELRVTR